MLGYNVQETNLYARAVVLLVDFGLLIFPHIFKSKRTPSSKTHALFHFSLCVQ